MLRTGRGFRSTRQGLMGSNMEAAGGRLGSLLWLSESQTNSQRFSGLFQVAQMPTPQIRATLVAATHYLAQQGTLCTRVDCRQDRRGPAMSSMARSRSWVVGGRAGKNSSVAAGKSQCAQMVPT